MGDIINFKDRIFSREVKTRVKDVMHHSFEAGVSPQVVRVMLAQAINAVLSAKTRKQKEKIKRELGSKLDALCQEIIP